jgi:hypothetical protein
LAEVEHRGHARINRIIFVDAPDLPRLRQRSVDPPPPPSPWERGRRYG